MLCLPSPGVWEIKCALSSLNHAKQRAEPAKDAAEPIHQHRLRNRGLRVEHEEDVNNSGDHAAKPEHAIREGKSAARFSRTAL